MVGIAAEEIGEVVADYVRDLEVQDVLEEGFVLLNVLRVKVDMAEPIGTEAAMGRDEFLHANVDLIDKTLWADKCEAFAYSLLERRLAHDFVSCGVHSPPHLGERCRVSGNESDVVDPVVLGTNVGEFMVHIRRRQEDRVVRSSRLTQSQHLGRIKDRFLQAGGLDGNVPHF